MTSITNYFLSNRLLDSTIEANIDPATNPSCHKKNPTTTKIPPKPSEPSTLTSNNGQLKGYHNRNHRRSIEAPQCPPQPTQSPLTHHSGTTLQPRHCQHKRSTSARNHTCTLNRKFITDLQAHKAAKKTLPRISNVQAANSLDNNAALAIVLRVASNDCLKYTLYGTCSIPNCCRSHVATTTSDDHLHILTKALNALIDHT